MDWDALGAMGEIIGAIAVLATLYYLSNQIKINSEQIVSPIVYNFQFRKVDSHWKIDSREIKLDAILDVP